MSELWQHQKQAKVYMNQNSHSLLQMGVATGKTRTVLDYLNDKNFENVLIVGTKNSIHVWEQQSQQFNYGIPVSIFKTGTIKERALQIKEYFRIGTTHFSKIAVISYEATQKKIMLEVLKGVQIDCIVYDEIHRLRGHTTKQSKNAYNLARFHPKAVRIGLTGTLIYDKPLDIFGIYRFIDPSLFGVNWNTFRFRYAIWAGERGFIPVKYINRDELNEKVIQNSFIIKREDVLDLPKEQHIELEAEFSLQELRDYIKFDKTYILGDLAAHNILDKVNKLQQMSSGFIYNNGTESFSNAKASALEDELSDIRGTSIIFYKFRASLDLITQVGKKIGRRVFELNGQHNQYDSWKADDIESILAVQLQSGSEGIDFTKAAITFFWDLPYSWGQFHQATGRTSRPNQESDHVLYYYLIVKNSIDEHIMKVLKNKGDLIEEILNGSYITNNT